jgi:hypothetical protein
LAVGKGNRAEDAILIELCAEINEQYGLEEKP